MPNNLQCCTGPSWCPDRWTWRLAHITLQLLQHLDARLIKPPHFHLHAQLAHQATLYPPGRDGEQESRPHQKILYFSTTRFASTLAALRSPARLPRVGVRGVIAAQPQMLQDHLQVVMIRAGQAMVWGCMAVRMPHQGVCRDLGCNGCATLATGTRAPWVAPGCIPCRIPAVPGAMQVTNVASTL